MVSFLITDCYSGVSTSAKAKPRASPIDETELEIDNKEVSAALQNLTKDPSLSALPQDCIFGDGGAYSMMQSADSTPAEVAPASSSQRRPLKIGSVSFVDMLESTERMFTVGSGQCVVKLNDNSKSSIVASVYDSPDCQTRLGTISTAEQLSIASGLKAVCDVHKEKKAKACQCWLRLSSKGETSAKQRKDLFDALCSWIADGPGTSKDDHHLQSYNLRVVAGMNPRGPAPRA